MCYDIKDCDGHIENLQFLRAEVCDCGTPWTFLIFFFFYLLPNGKSD